MHALRLTVCLAAASLIGATFAQGVAKDVTGSAPLGASGLVALTTSVGDISVRTWSNPTVRWVAHEQATSPEDLARMAVEVAKDDGDVSLRALPFTGCERCAMDLAVWVPRTASVTAGSAHGNISITGVASTVIARTERGNIQIGASDGDVMAVTQVGDISARLPSVSGTRRVSLATVMGDVMLAFPRRAGATLTATTEVGDISSAFGAATSHARGQSLASRTGDGSILVKISTHTGDVAVSAL